MTKTTRASIKSVNKSNTEIAANAAAEKARKLASKAALKATEAAAKPKTVRKPKAPKTIPQVITTDALEAKRATEAANALKSQREDYEATLGSMTSIQQDNAPSFTDYLAEQGLNPDGTPRAASAVAKPGSYQGPMLALRTAAQHYTKGVNGNPHCNDWLASSLAGLTREQVVACLILVMKLEGNPYPHLNPGQQSMNLRNKARGMAKNGLLTVADLDAAIERQARHPS